MAAVHHGMLAAGTARFQRQDEWFNAAREVLAAKAFPKAIREGNTGARIRLDQNHVLLVRRRGKELRYRNAQGLRQLVQGTDRGGRASTLDHTESVGREAALDSQGAHGGVTGLTELTKTQTHIDGN